jgi:hypothetical protein
VHDDDDNEEENKETISWFEKAKLVLDHLSV